MAQQLKLKAQQAKGAAAAAEAVSLQQTYQSSGRIDLDCVLVVVLHQPSTVRLVTSFVKQ